MLRLAAIGLGGRASSMVMEMRRVDPDVQLTGVVDPAVERVRVRLRDHRIPDDRLEAFESVAAMLAAPAGFDGLIIGTRCYLHTPMAVEAAAADVDLPLFLEKPVAIDFDQLEALGSAWRGRERRVLVSFPLRTTPLFGQVLRIIRSGRLGVVNQVMAFNDVPYGGTYFANWYRSHEQTGGLWLQKATHDLDYITAMIRAGSDGGQCVQPTAVAAMTSRTVYGGDKPEALRCRDCDEIDMCPEGPPSHRRRGSAGGMGGLGPQDDHLCCFAQSIKHQDAGSVIVRYSNGVHATYGQNFVARLKSNRRGARIVGQDATLEFDWYRNAITVFDHFVNRVDQIEVTASGEHLGGDQVLAGNFVGMLRDHAAGRRAVEPATDLNDGLLSAALCLAARESSRTHTFQPVRLPGQPVRAVDPPTILAD